MQRRACKLILGKDYINLDDARNQLDILSFEETICFNKAKGYGENSYLSSGKHVRAIYRDFLSFKNRKISLKKKMIFFLFLLKT